MKNFDRIMIITALIFISLGIDVNAQDKAPEPKSGFNLTKKIILKKVFLKMKSIIIINQMKLKLFLK